MQKRLLTLLIALVAALALRPAPADAQGRQFAKYSDMEHVEYVCVTRSMLRLLGTSAATVGGIHIDGITDALHVLLIITTSDAQARQAMDADLSQMVASEAYETLMQTRTDGEKVVTLMRRSGRERELVMHIDGDDGQQVFIVLTGTFTDEQLQHLLAGGDR